MREIKFRAWDKYMKRLSYVREIKFQGGKIHKVRLGVDSVLDGKNIELMQFTGLKDKNGRDIYEGDTLRVLDRDWPSQLDSHPELSHEQYLDSISSICEVVYNKDRFELKEIKGRGYFHESIGYYWEYRTLFKVIGNIYENPELLGESK